jgi:uncharacterized protein YraI
MRTHNQSKPFSAPGTLAACALALLLPASACVMDDDDLDPEDPAGDLGDEEWFDEGPLPEDESSDADESVDFLAASPRFQLPFPCGQTWAGQTRTNHSPTRSVDFNRSNDYGDAVVAAAAGRVTRVSNTGSTSYGRWIEISHGSGFTTRYAHLAAQRVSVGQTVRQGQRIGDVGSTGGSTGPHLHYEQRHNGAAVRAVFNGSGAYYYGTRNYKSQNGCSGTSGHPGRINTAGAPLTVRSGPGTQYGAVGSVADGTHVTIRCQKLGQSISGTYGTTKIWDKIGSGYVSDAYVYTGSDGRVAPDC